MKVYCLLIRDREALSRSQELVLVRSDLHAEKTDCARAACSQGGLMGELHLWHQPMGGDPKGIVVRAVGESYDERDW